MFELFNSFFASVFIDENVGSIPEVNQVFNGDSSQSLSEIKITSNDVSNKIIKLKDGKAPDDDGDYHHHHHQFLYLWCTRIFKGNCKLNIRTSI